MGMNEPDVAVWREKFRRNGYREAARMEQEETATGKARESKERTKNESAAEVKVVLYVGAGLL